MLKLLTFMFHPAKSCNTFKNYVFRLADAPCSAMNARTTGLAF